MYKCTFYVQCTFLVVVWMSEDDGEEERLVAEIPGDLKRLVDADERTNKEIVEAALWREFGGERKAALDRRIEEKERRVSMIQSEKNERERELEEERQELEALKAKRENKQSRREREIKDTLEQLDSVPWEPDNPAIQTNADDLGMEPSELIDRLEDYHAE